MVDTFDKYGAMIVENNRNVNAVSKWRSDIEYIQKQWFVNKVVSVNSITKIIRKKL